MLFVYYLLAKAEERECEAKFGQSYIDYKNQTSMFFPFCKGKRTNILPNSKTKKALILTGMYLTSLVLAFGAANLLENYSISSLYASYTEDSATIAVCEMDETTISEILTEILEREPLLEVWVDLEQQTVTQVFNIPEDYKYRNIPVAVY